MNSVNIYEICEVKQKNRRTTSKHQKMLYREYSGTPYKKNYLRIKSGNLHFDSILNINEQYTWKFFRFLCILIKIYEQT